MDLYSQRKITAIISAMGLSVLLGVACSAVSVAPTPASTETLEELLIRELQERLAAYPRPQPFRPHNTPRQEEIEEWDYYRQGLVTSVSELFSDARAQSLPVSSLADIFTKASGLPATIFEGPSDLALISIVGANPEVKIGGGSSPYTPPDAVYILNRQNGVWSLGLVISVIDAAWVKDYFVVLVGRATNGAGTQYEVWHIPRKSLKPEVKFSYGQVISLPEPQLSSDGQTVTIYSYGWLKCVSDASPTPCDTLNNTENLCSQDIVAWNYIWRDGQYMCKERYIVATATPSP